ncbi:MAG: glycosyltransferase family 1 protein [Alphaproteobacteria bacterium]|nr:glycosyltransferase family 1 protein [Alphaproteobacteria bacterium]
MKKPKVLIDLYHLKNLFCGLGTVSKNFYNELASIDPQEFEFNFLIPPATSHLISKKYQTFTTSAFKRYFKTYNTSFNLWHSLYQCPKYNPPRQTPQIVIINDLNFLLVPKTKFKRQLYLYKTQKCIDRAHTLVFISEFTKNHVLQNLTVPPEKNMEVIYCGTHISPAVHNYHTELPNTKPFLFSIGEFTYKKNFTSLVNMMAHVPEYNLYIAGNHNTKYGDTVKSLIRQLHLDNRVFLIGKINEDKKFFLYEHCAAFLFPSFSEGFGIPVVEAMQFGKPVVCSNLCSLPEIGQNFVSYFNNFEPHAMASCLKNALINYEANQPLLKNQIMQHASQFSWKNNAEKHIQLYKHILSI